VEDIVGGEGRRVCSSVGREAAQRRLRET